MNPGKAPVRRRPGVARHARPALAIAITWAAVSALSASGGAGASTAAPLSPQTNAKALVAFEKRVAEYRALREKVASRLPAIPTEATAQQVEQATRDLCSGIVAARAGAQVGDVFAPEIRRYLRRQIARALSGPDGAQLRTSILEDDPRVLPLRVNGLYPDASTLSMMPPRILEALPRLPEPLEFRFVGERLILLDSDVRLVLDWVDAALPRL
jgi:hypothetical protein